MPTTFSSSLPSFWSTYCAGLGFTGTQLPAGLNHATSRNLRDIFHSSTTSQLKLKFYSSGLFQAVDYSLQSFQQGSLLPCFN